MSHITIQGGSRLEGTLAVQGAKNSVLPILAAAILHPGRTVLRGCPHLSDVESSIRILRHLGCRVDWEGGDLVIDASGLSRWDIPDHLMREMRSSVVFLGSILARTGWAELSHPGGCELGPRPIDMHLSALRQLGANIREEGGFLRCTAQHMTGREITLSMPSVGATENAMLAACGAQGETVLVNAAREPEIADLQAFLCGMGCQVKGAGSSTICIQGRQPTHDVCHTVMPDRIAAATYLCAAASAGGEVFLRGAREEHLSTVTAVLREAGCSIRSDGEGIACVSRERPAAVRPVRTAPYPGFPTDAQAILMAALLRCRGAAVFEENMFENRYRHVGELARMGANVQVSGRTAVVTGVERLHGAPVRCTDLRGGAALCVAALAAEGETEISETSHIARGYEDLVRDLGCLGAEISRIGD